MQPALFRRGSLGFRMSGVPTHCGLLYTAKVSLKIGVCQIRAPPVSLAQEAAIKEKGTDRLIYRQSR